MSDAIQHECGIAFLRLKKTVRLLLKKIWICLFWIEENVSPNGETAQSRARWCWFGKY